MKMLRAGSSASTLTERRYKQPMRAVAFLLFAWLLACLAASPLRAQGSAVPGTIEAESFSAMSGVQTEDCWGDGGGLDVGWIDTGDWMNYTINPSATATYIVELRVASNSSGGTVNLMSGSTVLATITIPVTGGWQTWTTVSCPVPIGLAAGNQTIRLNVVSGGWNINWMRFAAPSLPPSHSLGITAPAQATGTPPTPTGRGARGPMALATRQVLRRSAAPSTFRTSWPQRCIWCRVGERSRW